MFIDQIVVFAISITNPNQKKKKKYNNPQKSSSVAREKVLLDWYQKLETLWRNKQLFYAFEDAFLLCLKCF